MSAKHDAARARALAEKARLGFAELHDRPRVEEASALLSESVLKNAVNAPVGGP